MRKDLDILIKECVKNGIGVNINTNCSLGNLTINNTGDYTLNFDLSATPATITMVYNRSEPFDLSAGSVEVVGVNATAPSVASEYSIVRFYPLLTLVRTQYHTRIHFLNAFYQAL